MRSPLSQRAGTMALAALLAALLTVTARPAGAQDQPIVLEHGFNSNGASWQVAADRMRHDYKVAPQQPTTNWRASYADQAAALDANTAPNTSMAMGHSNGGLISRQWNRAYQRNNRIATIGSLHRGAPLATNALNGNIYYVGGSIAYDISDAVRYYAYWEMQGVDNVLGYVGYWAAYNIFNWFANFGNIMANYGFEAGVGTGLAIPVLYDMSPATSQIIPALNTDANLAREAQAMSARVGITSQMSTAINQMFYTVSPGNAGSWVRARKFAWAAFLIAYEYYSYDVDPNDPYYWQLTTGAWRWALATLDVEDIDAIWCALNGTLVAYYRPSLYGYAIYCSGSDGVVPVESQAYPNGTRQRIVSPGPTHMQEKQDARTVDQLLLTLREDFNVTPRLPGEVARVVVSPTTLSVPVGSSRTVSSYSYTIDGALAANNSPTWSSSNPGVAAVTSSGATATVSGLAVGSAVITASNNGYSASTAVSVLPATALTGVSITGPSIVYINDFAEFYAVPVGGVQPLSYRWTVNGIVQSGNNLSTLGVNVTAPRLTVGVTVTDAAGATATASKSVTVKPVTLY